MPIPLDQIKAGKIASETREIVKKHNLINLNILEICDFVENEIKHLGGELAFPCNVSLNEVAAHYTAGLDDNEKLIIDGDLVTIDLGVHVNGYIADTATTISYNSDYDELNQAAEESLKSAIKAVKTDVSVGEIGRSISDTAELYGFKPITNLTGHSIGQYIIHDGLSIPNIWIPGTPRLKVGAIYAIEPFLTLQDGDGTVIDGGKPRIFTLISRKKTGNKQVDSLIDKIWNDRRNLPFTPRWYLSLFEKDELKQVINDLVKKKIIKGYNVLVEKKGKYVSQFEHTITPTDTGVIMIT